MRRIIERETLISTLKNLYTLARLRRTSNFRSTNLSALEDIVVFMQHRVVSRLRAPSGVVRWWRFLGAFAPFMEVAFSPTVARVVLAPSSAAIALSRRFLSDFNSYTIRCVSKIGSSSFDLSSGQGLYRICV